MPVHFAMLTPPALTPRLRRGVTILVVAAGLLAVLAIFQFMSNPYTPAGYVGYITRGALVGQVKYVGLQTGPTSTGLGWLLRVTNVSITPYTYGEEFLGQNSVLSQDNLNVGFLVHVIWRVRPDQVQAFVERYSTLGQGENPEQIVRVAYQNYLQEPLRTAARNAVQQTKGLDIKDKISAIGRSIQEQVAALVKDTPFDIISVVVGNIQYPPEVADAVAKKLAATQNLERTDIEIRIAQKEAEKRVAEARGIAEAMTIINQQLTPTYLQYEAIKAQLAMANSQNHTIIYVPVGAMGVPLVGDIMGSATTPPAPASPPKSGQ
jgi:regulator of protease activity HflC (stomatin/prohibitin superfamily)